MAGFRSGAFDQDAFDPNAFEFEDAEPGDDTTPDAFSFVDAGGVALEAVTTSAAVTISGLTAAAAITVTGGTYDINASGTFVSTEGTVSNGDTIRARGTASASYLTAVDVVVTIGGVSDTFTITTRTEPAGATGGTRMPVRRGGMMVFG